MKSIQIQDHIQDHIPVAYMSSIGSYLVHMFCEAACVSDEHLMVFIFECHANSGQQLSNCRENQNNFPSTIHMLSRCSSKRSYKISRNCISSSELNLIFTHLCLAGGREFFRESDSLGQMTCNRVPRCTSFNSTTPNHMERTRKIEDIKPHV